MRFEVFLEERRFSRGRRALEEDQLHLSAESHSDTPTTRAITVTAAATAAATASGVGNGSVANGIAHPLPALFREELFGGEKADANVLREHAIHVAMVVVTPSRVTHKETTLHVDGNLGLRRVET
jgi:hypothetical protein